MTPSKAVLFAIIGSLTSGTFNGQVNMIFDKSLNCYYLADKRKEGIAGSHADF
jgi:hypothetical protein